MHIRSNFVDGRDGLAKRGAGRKVERNGNGWELPLMVDRKRFRGGLVIGESAQRNGIRPARRGSSVRSDRWSKDLRRRSECIRGRRIENGRRGRVRSSRNRGRGCEGRGRTRAGGSGRSSRLD